MAELGYDVSPLGIVNHFDGLIDGITLDNADSDLEQAIQSYGLRTAVEQTLMTSLRAKFSKSRIGAKGE